MGWTWRKSSIFSIWTWMDYNEPSGPHWSLLGLRASWCLMLRRWRSSFGWGSPGRWCSECILSEQQSPQSFWHQGPVSGRITAPLLLWVLVAGNWGPQDYVVKNGLLEYFKQVWHNHLVNSRKITGESQSLSQSIQWTTWGACLLNANSCSSADLQIKILWL